MLLRRICNPFTCGNTVMRICKSVEVYFARDVTFHTRTMHLLHGVGASAKMPVFGHFVCIIVAIHTE